jgi:hypothetical protein
MIKLIRFILNAMRINIRVLCFSVSPVQTDMPEQNLCGIQRKITASQYRKNLSIWELGKNKFT